MNFERKVSDDEIEILEIDDYEIEIIEVDDDLTLNLPSFEKKISNKFISKVRSFLSNKKAAIVTTCAMTLVVTLSGVFMLSNNDRSVLMQNSSIVYSSVNDDVNFYLNDSLYDTVLINGVYEEKGATAFLNGVDVSKNIVIDDSNLNISKAGVYHIIYKLSIGQNEVRTLYRTINVVDNEQPVITLLGSNVYTMMVGDVYNEQGFFVSDNSNLNLNDKVSIESNIDSNIPGTYFVKYSVKDECGNEGVSYRTVIVKNDFSNNTNSVLNNYFTDNGIFLSGSVQNYNFTHKMILKNKTNGSESVVELQDNGSHYYSVSLDVTNMDNGDYDFYLVNDCLEPLASNMTNMNRIVRSHVGNKLITMSYDKNIVNMNIQDFEYLYDVVIDPGHGGSDYGAVNGGYYEKSINLIQSMYEKKRFEDHGLKVLLLRDSDDDYGLVMGDDSFDKVERKAFAVGYYGSVSKIVYSNHHNSANNGTSAGWEIIVPSSLSYDELKAEHDIADIWSNMYIEITNPYYRFYTKDFATADAKNKYNGEVYNFDDFYAVIRIPNKLFGVKNVLYEGAYINNFSDMYWYYDCENWKQLSEVKIKAYVESLGIQYIAP